MTNGYIHILTFSSILLVADFERLLWYLQLAKTFHQKQDSIFLLFRILSSDNTYYVIHNVIRIAVQFQHHFIVWSRSFYTVYNVALVSYVITGEDEDGFW